MRQREAGQAFILVLIVLAIGTLLVVPAMRLTGTSLKSSEIIIQKVEALYAADGAQEYVLWKLRWDYYADNFTAADDPNKFTVTVCGTPVNVTVIMRAVEGLGGITLATDDTIRPTKTVTPSSVSNDYPGPYTYTIKLEQLSDNTTQGLDAVYDVLPKGLDYVAGSSRLSVDGGAWTDDIGEPSTYITGSQNRLRWPASGNFTSPMRDFDVRQVKEIEFRATGSLLNNRIYYNWVLLKVGDSNTLSGPTGNITLGDGRLSVGGLLEVSKRSDPNIIPPGVETSIRYEVKITNLDGETHQIQSLTDYLPPGFSYSTNIEPPEIPYAVYHPDSTLPSGITNSNPDISIMDMGTPENPDDDRYRLYWEFSPAVSISSYVNEEDILYLYFSALTTKDVSGSYYNEVIVEPNASIDSIFQPPDMTVTRDDFNNSSYSWNTGVVMVPAYDSRTDADGLIIDANMALILGGISITSWQIY